MSDTPDWVMWLLVLSGSPVIAVIALYILHKVASRTGRTIVQWANSRSYVREARAHNKRARKLRLEKNEWNGFPLPQGREGTLRITPEELINNPHRVGIKQLERQYEMRAEDLWIEIETTEDIRTGDTIMRWKPRKGRRPREVY